MQILSQKLKMLKDELKVWNKIVFGDIHNQVQLAVSKLDDIQQLLHIYGHNDDLSQQKKNAKIELEKALIIEEEFWREKARI